MKVIFGLYVVSTIAWNYCFGFYEAASIGSIIWNHLSFAYSFASVVMAYEYTQEFYLVVMNGFTMVPPVPTDSWYELYGAYSPF